MKRELKSNSQTQQGITRQVTQSTLYGETNGSQRHKLPESVVFEIQQRKIRLQNKNKYKNKQKEQDRVNQRLQSKFKFSTICQKFDLQFCPICQIKVPTTELLSLSHCSHLYCASCLYHVFQQVQCPQQSCKFILDIHGHFYSELPLDVRNKYKKIRNYQLSKQQGKRHCPQQNCDGLLEIKNEDVNLICSSCSIVFCKQCFFQEHKGPCDSFQVVFFESNLRYRQCKKCKNVIEKISGCNHMTCLCGYQFCYICGKNWRGDHFCVNPQVQVIQDELFCETDIHSNECFYRIVSYIIKMFGSFLIITILMPINVLVLLIFTIIYLLIALVVGLTFKFITQVRQQKYPYNLLYLIIFPYPMAIGLKKSFKQIICIEMPTKFYEPFLQPCNMLREIWEIQM